LPFFTVKELFVLMNHLFTFKDKSSLFGKCDNPMFGRSIYNMIEN